MDNKQKLVTVITANYVELLVPDLFEKSFEIYKGKDFSKRNFQVSIAENAHATAGIVLTLLSLEAYRNRIYYLEKKSIDKLPGDISNIFKQKQPNFPEDYFTQLLTEMTIVRDVIVHNHLYEVEIVNDGNWDMISHKQKLLKDYGDFKRLKSGLVIEQTRKTKNLQLNVQPAKIGFEDLFTILVVFDLFVGISNKLFPNSYVPFHFSHQLEGRWVDNFSHYLSFFYISNPSNTSINKLRKNFRSLELNFAKFLPEYTDYFLGTTCVKCKDYGFHQPFRIYKCSKCGFEITLHQV